MMKKHNTIISIIAYYIFLLAIVAFALSSCGSTRQTRKTQRAERKVEKLILKSKMVALEAGITIKDTIQATVYYIPKPAKIDTLFSTTIDSVTIQNDDLIISYKHSPSGVHLSGEIKPNPKEFVADIVVDTTTKTVIKEKKLTWWEKKTMQLGNGIVSVLLILLLILIYLILRKFIKWLP